MEAPEARLLRVYALAVDQLLRAFTELPSEPAPHQVKLINYWLSEVKELTALHLSPDGVTKCAALNVLEQSVAYNFMRFEVEMLRRDRDALSALLAEARKGSLN